MQSKQPIGVFDSGVGGLTVLSKLAELLPHEDLLYLGDSARVPYGNKSPETIRLYAKQCTAFLLSQSVKLIVVACNTVSAVALDVITALSPVPVIGMIYPAAQAALVTAPHHRIGVIGTHVTVQSQAYARAIQELATTQTYQVHAQACPLFVPLVEEGWYDHAATQCIAETYLTPLREAKIDCLILGCTHYPLLQSVIQNIMPHVKLIDSGEEAAKLARKILAQQNNSPQFSKKTPRQIMCYVTDVTPTFTYMASQLLHITATDLHQVSLG